MTNDSADVYAAYGMTIYNANLTYTCSLHHIDGSPGTQQYWCTQSASDMMWQVLTCWGGHKPGGAELLGPGVGGGTSQEVRVRVACSKA